MDVQLPDGRILRGVPEGTTKAQIAAKMGLSDPAGQFSSPFATSPSMGFSQRVGNKWDERNRQMDMASELAGQGKISDAGLNFIAIGNTLGKGLSDVPAEAMVSLARATPQPIKKFAGDVYSTAQDTPVLGHAMRGAGYVLNKATSGYNKFKKNHPVGGLYFDAALGFGDAALAALPIKGQSLPSRALAPVEKTGKKLADKINTKTVRPTARMLKDASQANYAKAKNLGGIAPPSVTNSLIDKAVSFRPTDEMVLATRSTTLSDDLAKNWEQFRDQPMTLERATALDQHITDLLDNPRATNKNGVLNSEGREILEIKETLRNELERAAQSGEIGGGPEGLRAYQDAVKDWAAQSQISEIERIVERASYMDNPATSLKTGFRNIATNPRRLSKFPKNVQKAIKRAASDGDLTNLLRSELGSRLISGIVGTAAGSTMGPLGAVAGGIAGMAGSRVARGAAETMQMGRVNKVKDAIAANSSMPTQKVKRFSSKSIAEQIIENQRVRK